MSDRPSTGKTLAEAKIIARSSDPDWVGEELFRLQEIALRAEAAEWRGRDLKAALGALLDAVDYTNGACRPTEQVGAVLPPAVMALAKAVLRRTRERP